MLDSGVDRQQARDGRQQELSAKLLLDAGDRFGVQLTEREAVALDQLVELFDLPAQMVDLLHLRQSDFGSAQRGEQDPRIVAADIETDATQLDRLDASACHGRRWTHEDAVVVAPAVPEHLNRFEGPGLRHADHELDPGLAQGLQDLEGRIATIEHEYVAPLQVRQQLEQLLPFARGTRCDGGGDGEATDDVIQHRDQHLRTVPTVRHAEVLRELGSALQVMAHAIHREDATPVPEQLRCMSLTDCGADHREQRGQQLWLELPSRLAERGCGDRLPARQRDPRATRLFPERIEEKAVAATACIGGHEQEQGHQQLGREWTTTCEVRRLAATVLPPRRLEQLPNEDHQRFVERRQYGAAGCGQPLACQFADVSLLPRRIPVDVCRELILSHSRRAFTRSHAHRSTARDTRRDRRFPRTRLMALGSNQIPSRTASSMPSSSWLYQPALVASMPRPTAATRHTAGQPSHGRGRLATVPGSPAAIRSR